MSPKSSRRSGANQAVVPGVIVSTRAARPTRLPRADRARNARLPMLDGGPRQPGPRQPRRACPQSGKLSPAAARIESDPKNRLLAAASHPSAV
jgi:hypothetical protein